MRSEKKKWRENSGTDKVPELRMSSTMNTDERDDKDAIYLKNKIKMRQKTATLRMIKISDGDQNEPEEVRMNENKTEEKLHISDVIAGMIDIEDSVGNLHQTKQKSLTYQKIVCRTE